MKKIDLNKMETFLDVALRNETTESLTEWMRNQRKPKTFMKKLKKISGGVSLIFMVIIPIFLLVFWIFNPELTMMQMAVKFWYLLLAFTIFQFVSFWSEDIQI